MNKENSKTPVKANSYKELLQSINLARELYDKDVYGVDEFEFLLLSLKKDLTFIIDSKSKRV